MIATGGSRARAPRRMLVPAIVCLVLLAALAAPFVITVEPDPPPEGWHVNVRWAPSVSDAVRSELEGRYSLRVLQPNAERTWVYRLGDSSTGNIRALVTDPRVEDTHGIDRSGFRVTARRLTLARAFEQQYPDAADRIAASVSWRNAIALLLAVGVMIGLSRPAMRRAVSSRIPPLSSAGLGLYRIALGAALGAVVVKYYDLPDTPFPRELHRSYDWFANWEWVHRLAERPGFDHWALPITVVLLALFAVGFFARTAYLAFLCVLTVHVLVVLQHKSAHDWGLPLVTLWGLALVPWDQGIGVRRPRSVKNGDYGFAIWFPGVMIGLAFAAAAFAKFDSSGIAWVTGGAVKYHFLEDWRQAPTDWGLWIASRPTLAVLVSAGAIAIEAGFILHLLFRSAAIRALFAVPALLLLIGFRLLQGVVWTQWWVLFLAFVPWQAIAARFVRRETAGAANVRPALGGAAAVLVATLAATQVLASAGRVEMEPFISDFGMYSWTWPDRDAFDAHLARKYRRYSYRAWRDGQPAEDLTGRVAGVAKATDLLADVVEEARAGVTPSEERRRALASVASVYRDAYGEPLPPTLVLVTEQAFDWNRGAFYTKARETPVGILDVSSGAFSSRR